MIAPYKSLVRIVTSLVLVSWLTACVSTGEQRFSDKADPKKALQQYTELGLRYIQQGKTAEARRPLKRALEIDSRSADVHHALALMFQKELEIELADEHFGKALQFGPERTSFRNNYAVFLFGQRRYAQACQQFEAAGADTLYDNRAAVYENLGVCYLEMRRANDALGAFERALLINDSQPRALLEAALLHFDQANMERSAQYHKLYQKLVRFRMAPNTPRNLALGVRLARFAGDKDQEASYLLMLKNMFPDSAEYRSL